MIRKEVFMWVDEAGIKDGTLRTKKCFPGWKEPSCEVAQGSEVEPGVWNRW